MGLRFRRTVRVMPGVRLNFSSSGVSLSLGPRGASLTLGSRGVYQNVGLPGTGLSYRSRLDGGRPKENTPGAVAKRASVPETVNVQVRADLNDDGTLALFDAEGRRFPQEIDENLRRQGRDQLRALLEKYAADEAEAIGELTSVHLGTPKPDSVVPFPLRPFERPAPEAPSLRRLGWLWRMLWPPAKRRVEAYNQALVAEHADAVALWQKDKSAFEAAEARRVSDLENLRRTDLAAMEMVLEHALEALQWPRETNVSFEITAAGQTVHLDVDLPEVEDMPRHSVRAAERELRLVTRVFSERAIRQLYARHVHGIGFRLIGEVFGVLPAAQEVVVSGYTQRVDPKTGVIRDDYLLSCRVRKPSWLIIDFDRLSEVEPESALERFELRRSMTKTGIFLPIAPWVEGDA